MTQEPPPLPLSETNPAEMNWKDVKAELERSSTNRRSAVSNLVTLAITLLLFTMTGLLSASAETLIIIIAVLFVHECGHFIGMKIFGYRDVKMFFIPMLGAAVSGRQTVPSGAKQAIVALLGPLPGILVGIFFGFLSLAAPDVESYLILSRAFLFINAFNLLPFHPLDGAHFLERCLFSRNAKIEVIFRIVTGLCLIGVALLLKGAFLGAFAFFVLISAGATYTAATIAAELRKHVPPEDCSPAAIPDQYLPAIVAALDVKLRGNNRTASSFATMSLNVWERVCNRAPGIAATLGLLFVYAFTFLFALVAIFLVEVLR